MATAHPKKQKICAFCEKWDGNANLKFRNSSIGYDYDMNINGKCMATNSFRASHTPVSSCKNYVPSYEASKLL